MNQNQGDSSPTTPNVGGGISKAVNDSESGVNQVVISPEALSAALLAAGGDNMLGQQRINLLDSINMVPLFSGEDPLCPFAHFKSKFQECAQFFKWSHDVQMFGIQLRLAGKALQTYTNFKSQIKNVEDVFKFLKERFAPDKHPSVLFDDFWNFKQLPSMPVAEYVSQARQKVQAALTPQNFDSATRREIEKNWLMAMLLKNLDPKILRGVIAKNPETLEELESYAKNEEKAIWATSQPTPSQNLNPFAQEFVAATVQNTGNQVGQSSRSDQRSSELKELKDLLIGYKTQLDQVSSTVRDLAAKQGGPAVNNLNGSNFQNAMPNPGVSGANNVNGGNNRPNFVCYYCFQPGHTKRYCRQFQQAATWAQTQQSTQESGSFYQNRGGFRGSNRGRNRGNGNRGNFSNRGSQGARSRGNNSGRDSNFNNKGAHNRDNNAAPSQPRNVNPEVNQQGNVRGDNLNC